MGISQTMVCTMYIVELTIDIPFWLFDITIENVPFSWRVAAFDAFGWIAESEVKQLFIGFPHLRSSTVRSNTVQ